MEELSEVSKDGAELEKQETKRSESVSAGEQGADLAYYTNGRAD